jgi:hypothetical protein
MTDLDQSGQAFQTVRVYLGPSLGWRELKVKPTQSITAAGTYALDQGSSIVMVNVAGLVTINLPSVRTWMYQSLGVQVTGFERAIWIKDFGGHADAFNITVAPDGIDKIDNLSLSYTIVQKRQLLRLYPLNDLTGWYTG